MLLHNKKMVRIKHKLIDKQHSITWHDEKDKVKVTINEYINGYLNPGRSCEYFINDLTVPEEWIELFVGCENLTVKAY